MADFATTERGLRQEANARIAAERAADIAPIIAELRAAGATRHYKPSHKARPEAPSGAAEAAYLSMAEGRLLAQAAPLSQEFAPKGKNLPLKGSVICVRHQRMSVVG
jgi:hypothetical protein